MNRMLKARISICTLFALMLVGLQAADIVSGQGQVPEATTYQIRNVKFGELLRPRDANNADGTAIVLYPAQPWKCMTWQLKPQDDSAAGGSSSATIFRVKNLFTTKTFCVDTNNDAAQQRVIQLRFPKNNGGPVPGWQFIGLGNDNYEIVDDKSGNVVTAIKDGEYEFHVMAAHWDNQDNQKWHLEKIDPKDLTM